MESEIKSDIFLQAKEWIKSHRSFVLGVILVLFVLWFSLSSSIFSDSKIVDIKEGSSLMQISTLLENENVIRSSNIFRIIVISLGGENSIKAGSYLFHRGENVFVVAWHLSHGNFGVPIKRIPLTEGMDSYDLVKLFNEKDFIRLDKNLLLTLAKDKEGYLFPDTYFMPVYFKAEDIISMMSNNFLEKEKNMNIASSSTSQNLKEILTMASIIEGEAKTDTDRKIVSGILWKRIKIGMPLQVDTTFAYINGGESSGAIKSDSTTDSPYNTYKYKGLPPGPISDPGLEAINAAMYPVKSDYLYYLSDKKGIIHYAKTFDEHKVNIEKYLK